MNWRAFLMVGFLMVAALISCSAIDGISVSSLNGVWTEYTKVNEQSLSTEQYSWGEGISVRNGSIDIDLEAETPYLRFGYLGGSFDIREVEQVSEDEFRLVFWFSRGGFEVEWRVHFIDKNTLYFEQTRNPLDVTGFGPENQQYRIDGPGIMDPPKRYPNAAD